MPSELFGSHHASQGNCKMAKAEDFVSDDDVVGLRGIYLGCRHRDFIDYSTLIVG